MEGAQPVGPDEWHSFLGNAIGGLREAAELLRTRKTQFEAKSDWFRKRKREIPRENSVSQALATLFEQIRSDQAISGTGTQPVDLRHISIQCEKPRPYDPGIGDESSPTDYALVLLKDVELDMRIEAKTILDDSEVRGEYLGRRGLLRFDDRSNPYTVAPYGGMVAYVVDSDAKDWSGRIANAVAAAVTPERSGRMTLGCGEHQVSRHKVSVTAGGRIRDYKIEVLHFVLEIDASPPRR
ncbi:hypothetical protein BPNPMPFG_002414 [Mesorhizobium sp. AR07]|uniref:hypothetical protein n=1 Tax=Mesorhizobium sp. AR07 TaxID=2865838 RepID=UPI00215FB130|nr:hypothetical protein [Mesorhizobium sp. AR07]UVK46712.1 hypothetical protein BPNPMPFG_002414 [Mesorhizobium sp. AR07]